MDDKRPPQSAASSFDALHESGHGRYCCKSLFAPLIEDFSGCRRGYRVSMWGTSSHGDELTGDFANELDAISIDDRGLFCLSAGKLSHGNLGLLQQNRPAPEVESPDEFRLLSHSCRDLLSARSSLPDPSQHYISSILLVVSSLSF